MADKIIPPRTPESHKDDYGRVLQICGSEGYTGAAYFAAQAAVRMGSGVVMLCTPEKIYPILAGKLAEPVVFPVACDETGKITIAGAQAAFQYGAKARAILIGCGLGQSPQMWQVMQTVCRQATVPLVIDADGINALSGHINELCSAKVPVILTPHRGEFARLIGKPAQALQIKDVQDFAEKTHAVIVFKSHRTVIAAPDGTLYQNTTGNPGMAKGGSGDVLAGMLVSLLGQGISPLHATLAAVFLHGAAGDFCANTLSEYGMTPSDMLQNLPLVLQRYNTREW